MARSFKASIPHAADRRIGQLDNPDPGQEDDLPLSRLFQEFERLFDADLTALYHLQDLCL